MDYQISVVMPALNEAGNIERALDNVLAAFDRLRIVGEVIVVDDGSRDATGEIATRISREDQINHQLPSPRIRVVRQPTRSGIGRAFWRGVHESRGDAVTMLPGDGENDAYEILRYLGLLEHVDIIVPFVFNLGQRVWLRRFTSVVYRMIVNRSFGLFLTYMNGTVVYRRKLIASFQPVSSGFFYQTEILVHLVRAGYLYAEVPTGLRTRGTGRSRAISPRSLFSLTRDYWKTMIAVLAKERLPLEAGSLSALRRGGFQREEASASSANPALLRKSS